MIPYCIVTSAINTLASLVLALAVYWKKPRGPANMVFCWFAATGALWSGFYFAWQTSGADHESALNYARLLSAAAILIPIAYFHFAVRLLGLERRLELQVGYVLAVVFAVLALTTPWIAARVEPRDEFPSWPVAGVLYPVYLLDFAYFFVATLYLFVRGFRAAEGLRRNQLRLVTLGTTIGFCGGATNFPLWFNIPVPPIGNGLVAVYVIAVGYAIIRFRLMDFDLIAARAIAYTTLTACLGIAPPLILLGFEHVKLIAPGEMGFWPVFFVSSLSTALLLWVAPVIRRRVDSFLEQRILGERLADRDLLRGLVTRIGSAQSEAEMFEEVVRIMSNAVHTSQVAIYTRTEFETDFAQRAVAPGWSRGAASFPERSLLAVALRERQSSVLFDELEHGGGQMQGYFGELRRKQGIELVVPVIGDTYFYGFITLGARAEHALYNDVDVSLLEAVGLQIGLSLRARQLERRASQTEKLISLGTLAAGLAHELRNPLTSIQTFTALMKDHAGDPDFQQEFGGVVQRDVNRIASIVENVAAFAESNKVAMTSVNLTDVLRTVSEIVRPELQRTEVQLTMPQNSVPPVRGNHSQLLQVFLNLTQNAIQALDGRAGGRIIFSLESRVVDVSRPLLFVTVADNGPGIDPAMLPRIFEPFTTTKATGERRGKQGMGLGLAIVKRIVQHHHGDIDVDSTVGHGTTFRVHLPLA